MTQNVGRTSELLAADARNEHEQLIVRLLADPTKREAMEWLKDDEDGVSRTIGAFPTNQDSMKFVREIYDLGAQEVFVVSVHSRPKGVGLRTGKLVVALPQNPKYRRAIFDWCKGQGDSLGFTPDPDHGESHLFLLLD
jgi:hypothetical protein